MPYFSWNGIRIDGVLQRGVTRARSYEDLEYLLLHDDIGLISCAARSYASWFRPLRLPAIQALFYRLSLLINAGVPLDEALNLAARHCAHPELQSIVSDVIYDVHQGCSLADSICYYECFSPVMVHMLYAGQESGDIALALQRLCQYLQRRTEFVKRVRQTAFVPLVTFIFFMIVGLIILMYIVPTFANMFLASQKTIPNSTRIVLSISSMLQGTGLLVLIGAVIGITAAYKKLSRNVSFNYFKSYCSLRTPWLGNVIKLINTTMFLETFQLMLDGGVDIHYAFICSVDAMKNKELQADMKHARLALESGHSLSSSLQQCKHDIFQDDVYAMIEVGEESGRLPEVIRFLVIDQHEQMQQTLNHITTMVQPALMIVLGLLIAGLIFAVYIPIFDLSYVMN